MAQEDAYIAAERPHERADLPRGHSPPTVPLSREAHGTCEAHTMERVAPIFGVLGLAAAMDFYQRLGFDVRAYEGGGYGFAFWHGIELHLGVVADDDRGRGAAYLFVDDADRLAVEWRSAGVEVSPPQDMEWGMHEGTVVDPDHNVIRFGSPIG
jgi:Glyoxalase/Bleomycin resistance protein/Dioxygenase superfamily